MYMDVDVYHDRFQYVLFYEFSSHRYSMEADLAEVSHLISSGNHHKALEMVTGSSTPVDEDGNTLYHLAVLESNGPALRYRVKASSFSICVLYSMLHVLQSAFYWKRLLSDIF